LINYERPHTVNFGRIAGIKNNTEIEPASAEEVAHFKRKKKSYDPITGLNLYPDERLIRAREARGRCSLKSAGLPFASSF